MEIIGISGLAGSGKDTFACMLRCAAGERGLVVTKTAFADKLKAVLADVFGVDPSVFEDRGKKNEPSPAFGGKSPRQAAQIVGTEGFRSVSRTVWVNHVFDKIDRMELMDAVLITDVRFMDEAAAIKERGGVIISVTSPRAEEHSHSSEMDIGRIRRHLSDWVVTNDGTMDDLRYQASRIAKIILP